MLQCSKIAVLFAVVLAIGALRVDAQEATPAPLAGAIVSDWTGGVQVQLPGSPVAKPTRGEILPEESIIETRDGRLLLTIRVDESQVLLQPKTRIVLHQPSFNNWNTFELLLGRIRAFIQKRSGGAVPFQLGTPSAVIAVRGTRFDVDVNKKGVTEVDVLEGIVEVTSVSAPPKSVLVGPGFSTRVRVGGAPERPVPTQQLQPDLNSPDARQQDPFSRDRMPTGIPQQSQSGVSQPQGSEREGNDH